MSHKPIYVEIELASPIEEIWSRTQEPEAHERWDLRFSRIEYLPKLTEGSPQEFRYSTRLGFGLLVAGRGETVGSRIGNQGERSSALRFWSSDPKSLIAEGSGYWKYAPAAGGVRFVTSYDYRTRFGALGRALDAVLFRPLMGWATAWSFDRLRLWLERGADPESSWRNSVIHAVCRITLAGVWVYQGLIPKLLFPESGELGIVRGAHVAAPVAPALVALLGVGEILFGLLLVWFWRARSLMVANLLALPLLGLAGLFADPGLFVRPFNPASLTLAATALALIGLLSGRDLPSARRCRRTPPRRTP